MSKTYNAEEVVLDFNSDANVKESFGSGVMPDKFNYPTLIGGFLAGIVLIAVLIAGLSEMFNYYSFIIDRETQNNLKYVEKEMLIDAAKTRLSSTGVIDASKGVYHIPIDKAMDLLVGPSAK
jgi:hypothetical protein